MVDDNDTRKLGDAPSKPASSQSGPRKSLRLTNRLLLPPALTGRVVTSSYRAFRRRFFKIIALVSIVLGLAFFIFLKLWLDQDRINGFVSQALESVFDTSVARVDFSRSKTTYSFPEINGTGTVELYDVNVRSATKQYDWLTIPKLQVSYDLFRLPASPLVRVEIPQGLRLVMNVDQNHMWLDSTIFKTMDDSGSSRIDLPEIVVRDAVLLFRSPSLLAEPPAAVTQARFYDREFLYQGQRAWYLSKVNLALLRSRDAPGTYTLSGGTQCPVWGKTSILGSIGRDGEFDLRFTKLDQALDQTFVDRLRGDARSVWEMLRAERPGVNNQADVTARFTLKRDSNLAVRVEVFYTGSLMFRDIPVVIDDVRAKIVFSDGTLLIESAQGRRGSAKVDIQGKMSGIGTENEATKLVVNVAGLPVSEGLFRSICGTPGPNETTHYAEWEQFCGSASDTTKDFSTSDTERPQVPEVFTMLDREYRVSATADVHYGFEMRKGRDPSFDLKVMLYDGSLRYLGERSVIARAAADNAHTLGFADFGGMRSLKRLEGELPPPPRGHSEPVAGFPLDVIDVCGVIEGGQAAGQAGRYLIRGMRPQEAAEIETAGGGVSAADERGLAAYRTDGKQRLFVTADIVTPPPANPEASGMVRIGLSTENLVVDDELMDAIPENVRLALGSFNPRGRLDIRGANLVLGQDDVRVTVDLDAKGMTAEYRLEGASDLIKAHNVAGALSFASPPTGGAAPWRLVLSEMRGDLPGAAKFVAGMEMNAARPEPRSAFTVRVDGLELSDATFGMLPEAASGLRGIFSKALGGKVDVVLSGDTHDQRQTRLSLRLNEATIGLAAFAGVPLRGVRGDIDVTMREEGIEVQIHRLRGHATIGTGTERAGEIDITGGIFVPARESEDIRYALSIDGREVRLDSSLRDALDAVLGGTPGRPGNLARIWSDFTPESQSLGLVEFHGTVSGAIPRDSGSPAITSDDTIPDAPPDIDYFFEAHLSRGALTYKHLALPITNVSADVIVAPRVLRIANVSAQMTEAIIEIPGVDIDLERQTVACSLALRRLPLSASLRRALGLDIRKLYDAFIPPVANEASADAGKSQAQAAVGTLSCDLHLRMSPGQCAYAGQVELEHATVSLGIVLEQVAAIVACEGALWAPNAKTGAFEQHAMLGELQVRQASWFGIQLRHLASAIQIDNGRLSLPNLRADIEGGVLQGSFSTAIGGTSSEYRARIQIQGMSIESIAASLSGKAADTEAEPLKGGVDVELFLFAMDELHRIGRGRIDIGRVPLSLQELRSISSVDSGIRGGRPAALGKVPILSGLYDILEFSEDEYFNEAHITFDLLEDRIKLRELDLISDFMRVEKVGGFDTDQVENNPYAAATPFADFQANGDTNYILYAPRNGEQMKLTLVPTLFPRFLTIPGVQLVFDAFKSIVFRVYVDGKLNDPKVRPLTREVTRDDSRLPPLVPQYSGNAD